MIDRAAVCAVIRRSAVTAVAVAVAVAVTVAGRIKSVIALSPDARNGITFAVTYVVLLAAR